MDLLKRRLQSALRLQYIHRSSGSSSSWKIDHGLSCLSAILSLSLPLTSCQLCVPHGDALYQEIQSIIYRDTPISRHVIN